MRFPPTGQECVVLSTPSASAICDGLLRMAHCLIVELPEPELRDIRYTLDILLVKTDQILDMAERDLSLNFEGLMIDPDPLCAEDFGAIFVSTSVTTDTSEPTPTFSSRRRTTVSRVSVPAVTPAPTPIPTPVLSPAPQTTVLAHGRYPLVLSFRDNVGFPDYTYHPNFVGPGIPGAYQRPPTATGFAVDTGYYAITKGLYVGIFDDWNEVRHWVLGIPGNNFRKTKSWEEARDIYNACLASGAVRILV